MAHMSVGFWETIMPLVYKERKRDMEKKMQLRALGCRASSLGLLSCMVEF